MKLFKKPLIFSVVTAALLSGCGSTDILSTPIANVDTTPFKETALTDAEAKNWGHLDIVADTIPGMSVDKAYAEIIKGKKGKTVIVAVIDAGIEIEHEDLDGVLWTNKKEKPGNGIDDDKNGYIDDIHGWNFIGKGYDMRLESTRLVASGDTSNPRYAEAKAEVDVEYKKALGSKNFYESALAKFKTAHKALTAHFGKEDYTFAEVAAIKTEDETLSNYKKLVSQINAYGLESVPAGIKQFTSGVNYFADKLNFYLNPDFNGRKTGDNPDDFSQKFYGDGNVSPVVLTESHGTHVAGIIAAERNNGLGANGVANNVQIMAVRTVPNGDEYDKDVALAIHYAVDNGAQVINGSFGKAYSPHSQEVRDAIKYASDNNVVFVHAAGNASKDVDASLNFPDDNTGGAEISNTYIRVGALAAHNDDKMLAGFSNYGKRNVDVFAPGAAIYSTVPGGGYEFMGGTSMAAPAVAGVAALIRSYYPKLTAAQVKQVILDSGVPIHRKVVVGGNAKDVRPFADIVKSGKIVNAYNALIMASKIK